MQVLPIPDVDVSILQQTVGLPPPVADANLNAVLPTILAYNAGHHVEDLGKAAKRRKLVEEHEEAVSTTAELGEQVLFEHRLAATILGDAVAPPWFAAALAPLEAKLTNMEAKLTNMEAKFANVEARRQNRRTIKDVVGPLVPLVSVRAPNIGIAPPGKIFPATYLSLINITVANLNSLIKFYNEPQLNAFPPVTARTLPEKIAKFTEFIS